MKCQSRLFSLISSCLWLLYVLTNWIHHNDLLNIVFQRPLLLTLMVKQHKKVPILFFLPSSHHVEPRYMGCSWNVDPVHSVRFRHKYEKLLSFMPIMWKAFIWIKLWLLMNWDQLERVLLLAFADWKLLLILIYLDENTNSSFLLQECLHCIFGPECLPNSAMCVKMCTVNRLYPQTVIENLFWVILKLHWERNLVLQYNWWLGSVTPLPFDPVPSLQ